MDGSLFMRTLAVIAFLALAFPGRAEMDALSVSCSAAPSLPSPVLVVYGSEEPGSAEARWLKALQPGTEERRALDEYVRDVQFVTVPRHPSVKDWEEDGSLSRAAMHGVRMLPSVVFLDSKGRVFDLVEGGASAASLRERVSLLAEKAQRVRPVTRVNDIPKGGDPAAEASAICRELEQVPPEAWFRDYPGTMKRLENWTARFRLFLTPGRRPFVWRKTGKRPNCLASLSGLAKLLPYEHAWKRGVPARMTPRYPWRSAS